MKYNSYKLKMKNTYTNKEKQILNQKKIKFSRTYRA